MTPPPKLIAGRWLRFPGIGKGKSNRAGWCRLITPTLAIYGDWSSNFSATWLDIDHRDSADTARLLEEARKQQRTLAAEQRQIQAQAARQAQRIVASAVTKPHCYLGRKGFPDRVGLVLEKKLLVPMRDVSDYKRVISVQTIAENGEKKFLTGGRSRGAVFRIGAPPDASKKIVLVEGYATGLSVETALRLLPGPHVVIICFSAHNLELVAPLYPHAVVCADNDESKTGETAARATGLKWAMPPDIGDDFNDLHRRHGLHAVTEVLRTMF